jgi:hypothetical protein
MHTYYSGIDDEKAFCLVRMDRFLKSLAKETCSQQSPLDPILSQMNPIRTIAAPYFFKVHSNIILILHLQMISKNSGPWKGT